MELKRESDLCHSNHTLTSNCTNMELKLGILRFNLSKRFPSNCTNMELKPRSRLS